MLWQTIDLKYPSNLLISAPLKRFFFTTAHTPLSPFPNVIATFGHKSLAQMKKYAIIVAGGSGTRMEQSIPKQFLELKGKPILMHTIEAFANSGDHPEILLVLSKAAQGYWKGLLEKHALMAAHPVLIEGGASRFHSVKNALEHIVQRADEGEVLIAVHDGVRPLVSTKLINDTYRSAMELGAVVATMPSKDSLREVLADASSRAVDRARFFCVQTPQTFRGSILLKAYEQAGDPNFTDDASVVESFGYRVHMVRGDTQNIKITFPEDLAIAEAILGYRLLPTP